MDLTHLVPPALRRLDYPVAAFVYKGWKLTNR